MVEAKYFKDYNHNYMILKCDEMETGEGYRRSMLAYNKIDGILKCSVRNVNGAVYYYYDISSKVTIENLYRGKKMSYEQVWDLFRQIDMIYRNLGQFLMEERGLLLQPDCIFYDFTSKKYFGIYYLMKDAQSENPYEPLMDFLLNQADMGNQKLADIIYQVYEMSESPSFSITDALAFFDEEEDVKDIVMTLDNNHVLEDKNIIENETIYNHDVESTETNGNYDKSYEEEVQAGNNKNRIYYTVFAVISLCGVGAVLWIYNNYILTQRELMMVMCCMAVMALCFIFSVAQVMLSGRKMRRAEQEERELIRDIEDEFRDEGNIVLQDVLDKNMNADIYKDYSTGNKGYSETIFLDVQTQDTEYKLYALDSRNKRHIELTQFPFTIGKMAGCVDCVLSDGSISRLHARIEKRDDRIFLTDMNSTNGTYKNGLRMQPSETVEIEPGDEIRFGKLNYCYR